MLKTLDDQVRDCFEHAADCAKRAEKATNERERQDWRALEKRYLSFARSIELARRKSVSDQSDRSSRNSIQSALAGR